MKLIKLAIISFVFLFLLITVISLFIPSHIRISRAVRIHAAKEKVMEQIAQPPNWKNWYPGTDSSTLIMVEGKPQGIMANKKRGQGLIITAINDSAVVAQSIGAAKQVITTGWNMMPGDSVSGVSLQWYMDFKLGWYPWEKFSSLLFEKQYGPQMEQGLNKLKKLVENN
ncbi:MAG TPA: SRPBCC family protein [Chitinophagaceae bacterium]